MSVCKVTRSILSLTDISIDCRAVLLFMIDDKFALDHVRAINNRCNLGKTKSYRIINELIEKGYIKRKPREEYKYRPLAFTSKTLRIIK